MKDFENWIYGKFSDQREVIKGIEEASQREFHNLCRSFEADRVIKFSIKYVKIYLIRLMFPSFLVKI